MQRKVWFLRKNSLFISNRNMNRIHAVCLPSCFSHVQLFVTPWTVTCQAPLSIGILQVRILEWAVISSCRGSSQPRDQTQVSQIAGRFFTISVTREALIFYHHIYNRQLVGSCCIIQGAQFSALWWWKGWEGSPRGRGYMYTYSWFTVTHSKN